MKFAAMFAALVLVTACSKSEVTTEDLAKSARETLTEMREKSTVKVQVRLEKTELPSETDLQLRKQIEEAIEKDGIGRVKMSDAGVGQFTIHVEVDSTEEGVPRLRDLLESLALLERSTVSVESN